MDITGVEITDFQKNSFSVIQHGPTYVEKVLSCFSVAQSVHGSYSFGSGNQPLRRAGQGGFFIAPAGVRQKILQEPEPGTDRMACRWVFLNVRINDTYMLDQLYDFPAVVSAGNELAPGAGSGESDAVGAVNRLAPGAAGEASKLALNGSSAAELTVGSAAELNALFDEIFAADNLFDEYACTYRMLKLLLSLAREKDTPRDLAMQKTSDYIEAHLASDLSVEELAANVCLSVSGFHAAFRKYFDLSPIRYVNFLRLSKAADQLLNTDLPVAKIGESVGISDAFYFSRAFKRQYGMSPRQYRESLRSVEK